MSPYVFVIATLVAIIPILIIFKISIERIKEDQSIAQKAQIQFMVGAALSEIIPIIIIVYAFTNKAFVQSIEELYIPGIIILLAMGISSFFILLQRFVDVDQDIKLIVNQFTFLSLAMTASLPVVSIVGLFLMMP